MEGCGMWDVGRNFGYLSFNQSTLGDYIGKQKIIRKGVGLPRGVALISSNECVCI